MMVAVVVPQEHQPPKIRGWVQLVLPYNILKSYWKDVNGIGITLNWYLLLSSEVIPALEYCYSCTNGCHFIFSLCLSLLLEFE